jgi:predicted porin
LQKKWLNLSYFVGLTSASNKYILRDRQKTYIFKRKIVMKKILIAALALASSLAFAGTATFEGSKVNGLEGAKDAMSTNFAISESINKNLSVHTQLTSQQTDSTNAISTRLEVGGTYSLPVYGPVTGYTKVALGQKYSTAGQFTYYSIEPGLSVPLTSSLTAKVGYRYRTAAENPNVNKDTTDTVRIGVSYAINKQHAVGVRYDRMTGDSRNDSVNIFVTRSF